MKKRKAEKIKFSNINTLRVKTEKSGWAFIKSLLIIFSLFFQFALLFLAYFYVISLFKWLNIISFILSLLASIHVISSNKNGQSKSIWVLFLVTCYSFSYIVYLISDQKFFWKKHQKRYKEILKNSYKYQSQQSLLKVNKNILPYCNYFLNAGNFISYKNSECEYLNGGEKLFDELIEDIKHAKKFIFLEFFIISDGILLNIMLNILTQKAKQGVDIRIIYDDLGSHRTLSRKTKKQIKNSGIQIFSFNKMLKLFSILQNYRDHRKIAVIDGDIAFTGGINIADEYVNRSKIKGVWKDCGIRITGNAVNGFTLIFLRQWQFITKQNVNYPSFLNQLKKTTNNSILIPFSDGLEYSEYISKNAIINLIINAKKKIYIMSPYFVIDDEIKNLLINKAKMGMEIAIILPEIADKKLVYILSRNNAEKLLVFGINVYIQKNTFVHSKVIFNEHCAIVGSINMDLRSFYSQFENAVFLNNENTLKQIETDFTETFNSSVMLNKHNSKRRSFLFKLATIFVNLFAPLM